MKLLEKHPGPWIYDRVTKQMSDGAGNVIARDVSMEVVMMFGLSPETLKALKMMVRFTESVEGELLQTARGLAKHLISMIGEV